MPDFAKLHQKKVNGYMLFRAYSNSASRMRAAGLAAALSIYQMPGTAAAQGDNQSMDSIFAQVMAPNSPGCVAGTRFANETPQYHSYGIADLEHGISISPATKFSVGSIAKMVTSLVIGTLVDEGKISLDSDIRPVLPELAHYAKPITVAQLLTHTSGIRDFRQLLAMSSWRPEDVVEPSDVSRVIARQSATSFNPGTDALYSNSDFFLLAKLASTIGGASFAEVARTQVFAPLGMNDSAFVDSPGELVQARAMGYGHNSSTTWRSFVQGDAIAGPGALYSTVPDLLRFLNNFETSRIGGANYLSRMEQPGRLANGNVIDVSNTGDSYGFGTEVSGPFSSLRIGHEGSEPGFAAIAVWLPEKHLSAAVACNTWTLDVNELMNQVISSKTGSKEIPNATMRTTRTTGPFIPPVSGTFQQQATRTSYFVHKTAEGLKIGSHMLAPNNDGTYSLPDAPQTLVAFRLAPDGNPELLLWNGGQISPEILKVRRFSNEPYRLSPYDLGKYSGMWYSADLDFTWDFKVEGTRLALIAPKWAADPEFFDPQFTDTFKGESGTIVEFTRDGKGGLTGFKATVDRARNVTFVRLPSATSPTPQNRKRHRRY